MDPLSITTGVLTLVTRSIGAVQTCQTYATKYKLADLSIAAVRTECASIKVALLQIQKLISAHNGKASGQQFEQFVLEEYEAVLSACSLTFALLNERLDGLGLNGQNERHGSDAISKINSVWKETTMESIRQNIRGQAIAITLLLTAFQSETTAKTYEIMKSQEVKRSLMSVSNDVKSLRDSVSMVPAKETDLETTGSVIGDEEFGFDDLVINSAAYRRVFMKQQSKLQLQSIHEGSSGPSIGPETLNTQSDSAYVHGGTITTEGESQNHAFEKQKKKKPGIQDLASRLFKRKPELWETDVRSVINAIPEVLETPGSEERIDRLRNYPGRQRERAIQKRDSEGNAGASFVNASNLLSSNPMPHVRAMAPPSSKPSPATQGAPKNSQDLLNRALPERDWKAVFRSFSDMQRHADTLRRPYRCDTSGCQGAFQNQNDLSTHMLLVHHRKLSTTAIPAPPNSRTPHALPDDRTREKKVEVQGSSTGDAEDPLASTVARYRPQEASQRRPYALSFPSADEVPPMRFDNLQEAEPRQEAKRRLAEERLSKKIDEEVTNRKSGDKPDTWALVDEINMIDLWDATKPQLVASGSSQPFHFIDLSRTSWQGKMIPRGLVPAANPNARLIQAFRDYYSGDRIRANPSNYMTDSSSYVAVLWPRKEDPSNYDRNTIVPGEMFRILNLFSNGWALGRILDKQANSWDPKQEPRETPASKFFPLCCVCLVDHWSILGALTYKELKDKLLTDLKRREETFNHDVVVELGKE
ncbi:uncharacterized protein LY89DRAFT_736867 [Mollisia scopiformis]|uniref:C2H2-type domain-containing protein n=1 Tax=Mollisia scopiformis TaxID=149040 RepID=A0A194X100_MOLSC|nr:uncharacterized protein LY89DRAFT_736867 [Mollisia scopiformis]KUJ13871.1 hypothetical protein LY89DRAFT_736867 [Mollisia scopiformis]